MSDRWLTAHSDPAAGIYTFSSCMELCDLHGDGDFKLVVADLGSASFNMKLRVYKGTEMLSEHAIIDIPTGIATFHMDQTEPRVPAVAVASGSHIYIYKNMRPYFKFTLPSLELQPTEKELWARANDMDISDFMDNLQNLRNEVGDAQLTTRTLRLLMCTTRDECRTFVERHVDFPLKRQSVVSCISSLMRSHGDALGVSCLVLGTENNLVYILDPGAFTILEAIELTSTPSVVSLSGVYDVDFTLVFGCRRGQVCLVKKTWESSKIVAHLDSEIVSCVLRASSVVVATMDKRLRCFALSGRRLWSITLMANPLCMTPVDVLARGEQLVAVGLDNGQVLLFKEKHVVDFFVMDEPPSALNFGKFGREDASLCVVGLHGGLVVRILRRTAHFERIDLAKMAAYKSNRIDNMEIELPKRSKLSVEQTQREKLQTLQMHTAFQHDLYLLRLTTARAYVDSLERGINSVSNVEDNSLKLSAKVIGLGPTFRLTIGLVNTADNAAAINGLFVTFYCDHKLYELSKNRISVPLLVPGLDYRLETLVRCVAQMDGIADHIRVLVCRQNQSRPLLSALLQMPVSEVFE